MGREWLVGRSFPSVIGGYVVSRRYAVNARMLTTDLNWKCIKRNSSRRDKQPSLHVEQARDVWGTGALSGALVRAVDMACSTKMMAVLVERLCPGHGVLAQGRGSLASRIGPASSPFWERREG